MKAVLLLGKSFEALPQDRPGGSHINFCNIENIICRKCDITKYKYRNEEGVYTGAIEMGNATQVFLFDTFKLRLICMVALSLKYKLCIYTMHIMILAIINKWLYE